MPEPGNPLAWDRYAYVLNNPVRYTDPSGNIACAVLGTEQCDENGDYIDLDLPSYNEDERPVEPGLPGSPLGLFTDQMQSPIHGDYYYSGFGGCNTYTGSCELDGWHPAIDSQNRWGSENLIVNWEGREIYSTAPGLVIRTGESDWGNYVLIQHSVHSQNYYSIYAHLSGISVIEEQQVGVTDVIGFMGGTLDHNVETSDHLHFEVRKSLNVNLTQTDPFQGMVWWPMTKSELQRNFVDLGQTDFAQYDNKFFLLP